MTAAAGFTFDGGLLFCADTKITADIKTNESKLIFDEYGNRECATLFTVAATDFDLAKIAVRDCAEAIHKIRLSTATIRSIRDAIQSSLVRFRRVHADDLADARFDFLIGIWMHGETRMYVSKGATGTALMDVERPYECIGIGAYLAKYLIKQAWRRGRYSTDPPSREEASLIAAYALTEAMEHDEYVGGEIEFASMANDGTIDFNTGAPLYPAATFPQRLQPLIWNMLRKIMEVKDRNKAECERAIDDFWLEVSSLNKYERQTHDIVHKPKGEAGGP